MLEINEKNHISVIIASLDKIYNQAKLYGKLNSKDIYYLSIVNKLLGCGFILTNKQHQCLISLYNKIAFTSNNICAPLVYKKYEITRRPKFVQAEDDDCNTYPKFEKIIYWQEDNLTSNLASIQAIVANTGYLTGKASDSYANFALGKDIDYTNIGRICFLALDSDTLNYTIIDVLGNNTIDAYDVVLVPELKATLFVSKNIYSHGTINFKINKI